jgi:hypothetical protein
MNANITDKAPANRSFIVKHNLGHMEYTHDELQKELQDLDFLRDAFLVVLNEKATDKSDLPFRKDEVLKHAYEMYMETNFSKHFIDECFGKA